MRNLILLPFLLLLLGCSNKAGDSYFTAQKASAYFREMEEICNRDNGSLWGKNLYGPVMLVERSTRRIYANQPDSEGLLKEKDGIYTGLYPNELITMYAPAIYGGTLYAMVPVPNEANEKRITSWMIHVLFHCMQISNGSKHLIFNHTNMDEDETRLWMKLEWKALKKAVNSTGTERNTAIRDALVFRCTSREFYSQYSDESNMFETYEGLATFTDFRLNSSTDEEYKTRLTEFLEWIYNMPSYASLYGNITGALYASLLYDAGYNLQNIQTGSVDLGKLVCEVYKIELPHICRDVAGSLALCYDLPVIMTEEKERMSAIQERLHKLTATFTDRAVVYLELEDPSFDFEPEDSQPVDSLGTLYNSMRVSDNWGKLAVDKGGCLVSGNFRFLRVTAKGFRTEKNRISGEGWNLMLNNGWELVKVESNYFLRHILPITGYAGYKP
ncbi:MAG TPA: hypothetical protein VK213_08875 [Bacteroidales bacterium]|nr:hypothetical protein [Bacteroidales bacterium]